MIIADDKKRIRIPAVHPRDVYHPETLTRDLIVLRRIETAQTQKANDARTNPARNRRQPD
ncbi:MAG: hypothetical protein WDM76_02455 [Limisphaerales bacterium]